MTTSLATALIDVPEGSSAQDCVPTRFESAVRIRLKKSLPLWLTVNTYWWLPTLMALVIIRYGAGRPVLGWDELATLSAAPRSVGELVGLASNIDAVLTPYYLFMHFWIQLFGDSEVALRMPSILSTAAAVGVTSMLARRLFSSKVALLTGLLLAVMPAITHYGQQARPYGFSLFFAVLATLLLFRALDHPSWWRWAGYGTATALLGLFHVLGLLLLLGHAAVMADHWRREGSWKERIAQRGPYLRWIAAVGVAVLFCLPLASIGLGQRSQLFWLPPMEWRSLENLPDGLFGSSAIGLVLMGVALSARSHNRLVIGQLTAIALLPVAGLYLMSFATPMWVPRYLIYTLAVWCLLAAVTMAGNRLGTLVIFALVLAIGVPSHQLLRQTVGQQQIDYRVAMRVIGQNYQPGDGIVYDPASAWSVRPAVRYYLPKNRPRDVLVTKTAAQDHSLDAQECARSEDCLRGVPRVWIFRPVSYNSTLDDFSGQVPRTLRREYTLTMTWRVANSTIEVYSRASGSVT
ncbi:MAG: glycosyltransferase family 39 protein [Mycobacteriales bacterium]